MIFLSNIGKIQLLKIFVRHFFLHHEIIFDVLLFHDLIFMQINFYLHKSPSCFHVNLTLLMMTEKLNFNWNHFL